MCLSSVYRRFSSLLLALLLCLSFSSVSAEVLRVEVDARAVVLIDDGFLLPDDRDRVIDRTVRVWDWMHAPK